MPFAVAPSQVILLAGRPRLSVRGLPPPTGRPPPATGSALPASAAATRPPPGLSPPPGCDRAGGPGNDRACPAPLSAPRRAFRAATGHASTAPGAPRPPPGEG